MKYLLFLFLLYVGLQLSRGQQKNIDVVTHGLKEHGTNVCFSKTTFYKNVNVTYTEQTLRTVYYMSGWGPLRKKYSRRKVITVTRSRLMPKQFPQKVLHCCSGWMRKRRHSPDCTRPICGIPCQNGGECIAPDKCNCKDGFDGKYCEHVMNDCQTKKRNDCEQVCTALMPGHSCSCWLGWRLKRDKRHCQDINECLRKQPPCTCRKDDGVCKALCHNTPGSYRCKCNKGYRLTTAQECIDINECFLDPHLCDQICVNTPGSYKCDCRSGYKLNTTTNICDDIDECKDHNGGCSDQCHNLIGSYVCTCPPGFYLGKDGKTCKLIRPTMKNQVICQTDLVGELTCGSYEERIMIIDAMYGRLTTEYCHYGNYTQDLRCFAKDSPVKYLKAACDNQASCVIFLEEKVFGDPCPGIEKYMQVTYDCMK